MIHNQGIKNKVKKAQRCGNGPVVANHRTYILVNAEGELSKNIQSTIN